MYLALYNLIVGTQERSRNWGGATKRGTFHSAQHSHFENDIQKPSTSRPLEITTHAKTDTQVNYGGCINYRSESWKCLHLSLELTGAEGAGLDLVLEFLPELSSVDRLRLRKSERAAISSIKQTSVTGTFCMSSKLLAFYAFYLELKAGLHSWNVNLFTTLQREYC